MYSEEEQRTIFIGSWDAVENFYDQTKDFGWAWLPTQILPFVRLLRAHGCDQNFYLKESSSSRLELLRGKGPFVPARHVRLSFSLPGSPRGNMTVTFEAPRVQLRWTQKMRMTPRIDRFLQLMAVHPTHCADDTATLQPEPL
jgi:hypothetical protein